jgi:hypothetical protein
MHEIKFCPWCGSKLGKSGNWWTYPR